MDDKSRQQQYLEASKLWAPVAIGKDWVGTKYLGGGSYGMATLFEYQGDNPNVSPRKIVVKQEGEGVSLKAESRILQRLMEYESNHIIKIYKAYHRTMGTGADRERDPPIVGYAPWITDPRERELDIERQLAMRRSDVGRIYLECASHGDLTTWMNHNCTRTLPSEENVWRLWECLLKGLMVLKHGTENWNDDLFEEEAKHWHTPIVHFDLKGPNILIGDNPEPGHERIRVHKLADFGLAIEHPDPKLLKRDALKMKEWIRTVEGRNSYHAPEQNFTDHPNRKIGFQTDIWNCAHIIYQCLNQGRPVPSEFFTTGVDPEPHMTFKAMGAKLLDPDREIYSRKLRGMILRCLALDPDERYEVHDLLEEVQQALEHWNSGDERDVSISLDEWTGTYPEWKRDLEGEQGMRVMGDIEKRPVYDLPPYYGIPGDNATEDEYDFGDVRLLFPTRKDVRMGFREMPFELGEAKRPQPLYPNWSSEGGRGFPEKAPESSEDEKATEDEDEAAVSGSKTTGQKKLIKMKQIAGEKRMRRGEEEEDESARSADADRGKRRRRASPKRTPTPQQIRRAFDDPRREYMVEASGNILSRPIKPTPIPEEEEEQERSAPWIREPQAARSQRADYASHSNRADPIGGWDMDDPDNWEV